VTPDAPAAAPEQEAPALSATPEAAPVVAAPAPPAPVKPQPAPAPKPEPRVAATPAKAVPTPKPVAPIAAPAFAPAGAFVVQLAALSDSAKAGALKTRAAQTGLPAYTDTVGKLTRVRVGPYSSREAAVAAAVKLAEGGLNGQVVAR
jgi:DedD protein